MNFQMTIIPDEGVYKNGKFLFDFTISAGYPHDAPKVLCKTMVYHPNIDMEGKICLNILREDWKPVLSISSVVYGLQFLFLDPNPDDPLNKEAAQMFQDNPRQFESLVQRSIMHGESPGSSSRLDPSGPSLSSTTGPGRGSPPGAPAAFTGMIKEIRTSSAKAW
eukprot:gene18206-24650_t